jgi:hypothetical protein
MRKSSQGSAGTTAAIRLAIRDSQDSLIILAKRYGINPKTVAKWRKREDSVDLPRGPKPGRHVKLTLEEEGIIVRFREHTLLPLDDCLYALQAHIPHLSRSSLHRCLQRHGISRLAAASGADAAIVQDLSALGEVHIDRAHVRSTDGTHYLFNAIEQASKFVFVHMGSQGDAAAAAAFLTELAQRNPCRIRRVFTLDAEPFVGPRGETPFGRTCRALGFEHCLAASPDPWTRSSGSRMEDMLQDVTFASQAYLVRLLSQFVHAYNFRRRLKTLRGKTPHEFLCRAWTEKPDLFVRDPHHDLLGLEFPYG